jgi:hypothetical protein
MTGACCRARWGSFIRGVESAADETAAPLTCFVLAILDLLYLPWRESLTETQRRSCTDVKRGTKVRLRCLVDAMGRILEILRTWSSSEMPV